MSFVASGVILAGTAIAGSVISANAAENAANTQANAAENAQQISQQEFNTITQQEQPFIQGGYGALSNLDYMLGIGPPPSGTTGQGGFTGGMVGSSNAPTATTGLGAGVLGSGIGLIPQITGAAQSTPSGTPGMSYTVGPGGSIIPRLSDISGNAPAASGVAPTSAVGGYGSLVAPFTADTFKQYSPAYQFQLQQGQQGVLNADAGSQGALSGATLKDLIGYNQNLANTSFNNAFNQYQTQQGNIFSRLSGIAQLGQAAAANTGQQGTALAGQAAQSATNIGTAQAAGQIGSANAISGGINSALPWLLAYGGG